MNRFLLLVATAGALVSSPFASRGQTAPALGAASSFALFTAVGAFDNVGPTLVQGDIGTNGGQFSGFPLGVVNGNIHIADTYSTQAATDVQAAFAQLSGVACVVPLAVYGGPVNNPQVLTPNSYCVGQATTLAGNLILDAQNNPNALFFLRVSGSLTTAEGSTVTLVNGASANNVYWQVIGRVDLGQNSIFRGTLLVDGAINLVQGATLLGRGLSRGGAITLDNNTVILTLPAATSWLGSRTTDWFTSTNWSSGVPTSGTDAVVPAGTAPYPLIASGSAAAKNLTIGPGASLTQSGGALDLKSNLANSGTLSATAGAVSFSGASTQIISGSGTTRFWTLAITNGAGVIQTGAVSVHGVLALANGGLSTNGQSLTLLSDAAGTALVDNTGGAVNGAAAVQRSIDPGLNAFAGYRHFSSPVANAPFSDLATPGFTPVFNPAYNTAALATKVRPFPTVFGYDEARLDTSPATDLAAFDKGYFSPPANGSLALMRGYTVNIGADQKVDLRGPLNNGPLSSSTLSRGTSPDAGWQLLGNPYPSPIDFRQTSGVTRTNLDDAIYVYQSTGPYAGAYRSYVNGVGNSLVATMQGFFARVSAGQSTGSLALNNNVRVKTLTPTVAFNRTAAGPRPLAQLRLQGSTRPLADDAYVYFEEGATAAFDAHFDAYKLPNTSGLSLSSLAGSDELSVNGLAPLTGALTVPLTVQVPAPGTYTLSAASLVNFGAGTQVVLLDTQTGTRTDLNQQASYPFEAAATAMPGRFSLFFGLASPLATNSASLAAQVQLFPNPAHRSFTLLLPAGPSRAPVSVKLFNPLGQLVSARTVATTAAGASAQFDVSGLAPGVYSLRLTSATGQAVKRLVVE